MQETAFPKLQNVEYSYKMKHGSVNPSHNFSISIVIVFKTFIRKDDNIAQNFFQLSQSWVNAALTSVSI